MTAEKTPERMCVACRKKRPASQMFRFVTQEDGEVVFDKHRRSKGRGANLCPERGCLEKAIERKAFNRAFKRAVLVDRKILDSTVS